MLFQSNSSQFNFDNDRQGNRSSTNSSRFSNENKSGGGGHCVEVRNMPLSATYKFDCSSCLSGHFISGKDGLKLIKSITTGNRVGIAYVKFSKAEGKELALGTTRFVRGSEVEGITSLMKASSTKAVDSYSPEKERETVEKME